MVKDKLNDKIASCEWLVEALEEKQGENMVAIDVSEVSVISDVFVLVTASSNVHMDALVETAVKALNEHCIQCYIEGNDSTRWRLIDGGSIIVHIFSREGRNFYALERIWGDAPMWQIDETIDSAHP